MSKNKTISPDYIFETSWEVCNKVGGIYTVLSTRAYSMTQMVGNNLIFLGPDVWSAENPSPWFVEDKDLFGAWREQVLSELNLPIRVGRWDIPGNPFVILIDYKPMFAQRDAIYSEMWNRYGVDSMPAYGDYHDSCMFSYASGMVIESFYRACHLEDYNVVAHFNEWQMGMGALYVKHRVPKIATLFTTHATSMGRSIAGNNLPLYDYLAEYDADQKAYDLNMVSKHSLEKQATNHVDCFTTVSDITAKECTHLLQRTPDMVTPNGFEKGFIPQGRAHTKARKVARERLKLVAEKVLGYTLADDTLYVVSSGRYECKNKGIDVLIDALHQLQQKPTLGKDVVVYIMVPAWMKQPRHDLQEAIANNTSTGEGNRFLTHDLMEPETDNVMNQLRNLQFCNSSTNRVKIIFVPSYLNGSDGIFNLSYYDLLIGFDVSVFPSYYEPWGYTPHESVAFSVPTITTTLAGFGLWALNNGVANHGLMDGVHVVNRTDANKQQVVEAIADVIFEFTTLSETDVKACRKKALALANKAEWKNFFVHYVDAYRKALHNSFVRLSLPNEK